MQLILGTAEFCPFGYPNNKFVSIKEIRKILALAKEGGINILDTAESYGCHDIIKREAKGFCVYTKTRDWNVNLDWGNNELRGILYHYKPSEKEIEFPDIHRWVNLGASVYELCQVPSNDCRILQVPLNIENDTFKFCIPKRRTVFVRSVFNRGKLLKKHSIKECLDYVKQYEPDGVIVGVQSTKELNQILKDW